MIYFILLFLIFSSKDIKLLKGKPYLAEFNSYMNFKASLALLLELDSCLPSGQDPLLIPAIVYLMGQIDALSFDIQHNYLLFILDKTFLKSTVNYLYVWIYFSHKPTFIKTSILKMICEHDLHDWPLVRV